MKRNTLNYLLDALLAVGFIGLLWTGLLIKFVLPPGSGKRLLWGIDRHGWGDVHFWIVVGFIAVLLAHLALHWQWISVTTARLVSRGKSSALSPVTRNLVGLGIFLIVGALSLGLVYFAQAQVRQPEGSQRAGESVRRHEPGSGPRSAERRTGEGRGPGRGLGRAASQGQP